MSAPNDSWQTSVAKQYRSTLDDLAVVLRGCPDDLWESSIWEVKKSDQWAWPPTDPEGRQFDDLEVRERKFRAMSAVWRQASHALFFTDLDLSATDDHWAPPPPFSARDEDGYVVPPTYSRDQLLDYVDHCGRKVGDVFAELTDDHAAAVVPHRNGDRPLADILLAGLLHLQLHSTQVRTFLRTKGVRCADE